VELSQHHVDALMLALGRVKAQGLPLEAIRLEHFALDPIGEDVAAWRREVQRGRGLVLLRGFPVDRLSVDEIEFMYFGLGLHFGQPVSQSNMGDLIGHVVDIGGKDARERAYRNSCELRLHTDRCDHVGMLCLQPAKEGGVSGYASALTVHNELLATRPDLLEALYAGYFHHRFGEQPAGQPPVTPVRVPIYSVTDGVPCVIYIRGYIDLAEEEGHITLTPVEREALSWFETISERPDVRLDFTLEPGELAFFNNCLVLHTRTAFEDYPEPERRRHLLRLWLMEEGRPAAEGVRLHKGAGGIPRQEGKGTYYSGRKATGSASNPSRS
jgi:hypothetical protein